MVYGVVIQSVILEVILLSKLLSSQNKYYHNKDSISNMYARISYWSVTLPSVLDRQLSILHRRFSWVFPLNRISQYEYEL
jgi:hypothetical protein